MLSLNLQRSPRRNVSDLHSQAKPASRLLHKSASVPKLEPSCPLPRPLQYNPPGTFVLKSGVKHHAFSPDVPYPLSYHRDALTCDALDHALLRSLFKSPSAIDFTDRGPPARCLDLGCGPGAWVIEAAAQWPNCQFVGFDVVNLQIPPHRLAPKYSGRIKWIQGNFLEPLPFGSPFRVLGQHFRAYHPPSPLHVDDEYFDHVHIRQIARGVPEDKWDSMIAEVTRVLKIGGSVEIFEEDIIFPVLPRSSTAIPRKNPRIRKVLVAPVSASQGAASITTTQFPPTSLPEHDHAILETLFYRLFERRFINLRPTALIMGTLNIHMRHAKGTPLINFPLPPASLREDPPPHTEESDDASSRSTTPRMFDQRSVETVTSRSSTPVPEKPNVAEDGQTDSTASSSRRSTMFSVTESTPTTSVAVFELPGDEGRRSLTDERPIAFFSDADLTSASSKEVLEILPEERLVVTSGTMGLNLYRSWQGVMACRQAMWDEYRLAVDTADPLLDMLEWEDYELDLSKREKFDLLMERYRADMEAHYSMADALVSDLKWKAPLRDTRGEDEGTKPAVAAARRDALILERSGIGAVPERSHLCRKARIFVGRKGAVFGPE